MSFLGDLFGTDAGDPAIKAAQKNKDIIYGLNNEAGGQINQGLADSKAALGSASAAYDPYAKAGTEALGSYSDALGLNGADGNARAVSQFQSDPGYKFQVQQGEQGAERAASAGGLLASGNTLEALSSLNQNLANQGYSSYLDRLSGLQGEGLTAASGQAGVSGKLSDLYQSNVDQNTNLDSQVAQGLMAQNNGIAGGKSADSAGIGAIGGQLISAGTKVAGNVLTSLL